MHLNKQNIEARMVKPQSSSEGCVNTVLHCKKVSVTYFGHLSCIPFVCVTRKVQGVLTI